VNQAPTDRLRGLVDSLLGALEQGADGPSRARRAHLSRFHFDRLVSDGLGEAPGAFRRRLLLERAAWRLRRNGVHFHPPAGLLVPAEQSAAAFFADASVDDWQVEDIEVRDHGHVAVCAYRWRERGMHGGAPFALAGIATDVLVLRDGRWRLQSHHVSMAPATTS
jgi:AraC-like DNA-binding protein